MESPSYESNNKDEYERNYAEVSDEMFWIEQVKEQGLGHLLIRGDLTIEEVYNRLAHV